MKITKVVIVKTNSDKVLARADVFFEEFILKGFKVLRDEKTLHEYVTPPSYLSKMGWRPLFRTVDPEDWRTIEKEITKTYKEEFMKESADELDEIGNPSYR